MGKKRTSSKKKTGGTLMGMRSGFKNVAGSGKKRKRKGQEPVSFMTVFTVLIVISLAVVLFWRLSL